MIKALYEKATGRPWTTGRHATMEFGPTFWTQHGEHLGHLSDDEVLAVDRETLIAYVEAQKGHVREQVGARG